MNTFRTYSRGKVMEKKSLNQKGAAGWVGLWLIGIPIPILLVFFLLRGCT